MNTIVIKPAKSARLTSRDNVRMDLGLPAGTPADAQVDRWIDQASSTAAGFCDRAFGRQIYRQVIRSFDLEGALLEFAPLNRIISVGIQGGAVFTTADYMITDGRLQLAYVGAPGYGPIGDGSAYNLWHSLQPAIVVDYEAGWLLPEETAGSDADFTGTTKLPAEVEKAVIQLIAAGRSEAGRDPMIKSESNEGIGSVSYYVQGAASSLPHPGAEATLTRYRNLHLA